jgi:hypothetical protein
MPNDTTNHTNHTPTPRRYGQSPKLINMHRASQGKTKDITLSFNNLNIRRSLNNQRTRIKTHSKRHLDKTKNQHFKNYGTTTQTKT